MALNDSATSKTIKSSSPSFHVVYSIFKPRDVVIMDYATFQAIAPTNMKIVAQNGGKFHILTNDGATIRTVLANNCTTIDGDDELAGTVAIQDFRNHVPSIRLQKFRQRYIS